MSNIFYLTEQTVYSVRYKPCCYLQHDDKCSQLGELHSTGDRNSNQVSSSSPGTRQHLSRETVVILQPRHQCPHKALQEFKDFLYFWYQATRSLAWASTWPGQVVVTQPWLSCLSNCRYCYWPRWSQKIQLWLFRKGGDQPKIGNFPRHSRCKKGQRRDQGVVILFSPLFPPCCQPDTIKMEEKFAYQCNITRLPYQDSHHDISTPIFTARSLMKLVWADWRLTPTTENVFQVFLLPSSRPAGCLASAWESVIVTALYIWTRAVLRADHLSRTKDKNKVFKVKIKLSTLAEHLCSQVVRGLPGNSPDNSYV